MEISLTGTRVLFFNDICGALRVEFNSERLSVQKSAGLIVVSGYSGNAHINLTFFNGRMLVSSGGISSNIRDLRINIEKISSQLSELGIQIRALPSPSELAKLGV